MRWLPLLLLGVACGGDADGDGFSGAKDCDDGDPAVHEGAPERCDGKDDDCNGLVDDDATDATSQYTDADGDGYGTGTATRGCPADGLSERSGDCDDANAAVNPAATEACDGVDDDCDGKIDDDAPDAPTWYEDADGDGFGKKAEKACDAPGTTWVAEGGDCNDTKAAVYPGADELCNGYDDDCDGTIDEDDAVDAPGWSTDFDLDEYGNASGELTHACTKPDGLYPATDCDDSDSNVYPGADEVCGTGKDDDCDGSPVTCVGDATTLDPLRAATRIYFGRTVGSLGDVDGDGVDEFFVEANYNGGRTLLFQGPFAPATDAAKEAIASFTDCYRPARLDDLDGDATAELGCLTPGTTAPDEIVVVAADTTGAASARSAGWARLSSEPTISLYASRSGDASGDGTPDLVAISEHGAWLVAGPVVSGSLSTGVHVGDEAVSGGFAGDVGDLDGDGVDDLVLGEPIYGTGGGAAFVFDGPITADRSLADHDGGLTGAFSDGVGDQVHVVPDLDGDGRADLLAVDEYGAILLVPGPVTTLYGRDDAGVIAIGGGGAQDVDVADFDGDGQNDLVAAIRPDGAAVLLGPIDGDRSLRTPDAQFPSLTAGFAISAAAVGDQDGDGYTDILAGDTAGAVNGAVYLLGVW